MKKLILLPLAALMIFASSCNDDENTEIDPTPVDPIPVEPTTGTLRLRLEHNFDGEPLNLNEDFITENGDTIAVSELKYFLSNIEFFDNEGNEYAIPDSYHLAELGENSHITLMDIEGLEPGTFTGFTVAVGVDEEANTSIENATGDLDPAGADGMIWSWNTGYKFIKFEGEYDAKDGESGDFLFHLGHEENYKTFVFDGGESDSHEEEEESHTNARITHDDEEPMEGNLFIQPEAGKITEIHLMINVAELFKSPTTINISEINNVAGTPEPTEQMMNNIEYTDEVEHNGWFQLHHVITFEE